MDPVEGEDIPFGPPPDQYLYRCSHCGEKALVNEVIIDFELMRAEDEGMYSEGYMPVLGCPFCNRDSMKYTGEKNPPEGR